MSHHVLRNSSPAAASSAVRELREQNLFSDVTLVCEDGAALAGHRVILAAHSSRLQRVLAQMAAAAPSPAVAQCVYLAGVRGAELADILEFIYAGEANISQAGLQRFLAVAELLHINSLVSETPENSVPASTSLSSTPLLCHPPDSIKFTSSTVKTRTETERSPTPGLVDLDCEIKNENSVPVDAEDSNHLSVKGRDDGEKVNLNLDNAGVEKKKQWRPSPIGSRRRESCPEAEDISAMVAEAENEQYQVGDDGDLVPSETNVDYDEDTESFIVNDDGDDIYEQFTSEKESRVLCKIKKLLKSDANNKDFGYYEPEMVAEAYLKTVSQKRRKDKERLQTKGSLKNDAVRRDFGCEELSEGERGKVLMENLKALDPSICRKLIRDHRSRKILKKHMSRPITKLPCPVQFMNASQLAFWLSREIPKDIIEQGKAPKGRVVWGDEDCHPRCWPDEVWPWHLVSNISAKTPVHKPPGVSAVETYKLAVLNRLKQKNIDPDTIITEDYTRELDLRKKRVRGIRD